MLREFAFASVCLAVSGVLAGRTLTDAAGRAVTLPDAVSRVAGTAPPPTLLVYAIDPALLVSLDTPIQSGFYSPNTRLLLPAMAKLPVTGGWHGAARGANMEALLALEPQVVIAWRNSFVMEAVLGAFRKFDVPVVFVNQDRVADIPGAFRLAGQAVGRPERGEKLAADAEARLAAVRRIADAIPPAKRPGVYYAQGPDGLQTQFEESFHYDPIRFAGGRSLFPGGQKTMMGMERVSLEEVLKADPDIIIASDAGFASAVMSDARWKDVAAVKNRRVFLVPNDPVNLIDRPPAFQRVLGVQWLASVIHPGAGDIVAETISFYRDYLHVEIDAATARRILRLE